MKKTWIKWLEDIWYKEMYLSSMFMPLSMLYVDIIRVRRFLYQIGVFKTTKIPAPVIVIGNITVGGTGKTPLVIWLAEQLIAHGYQPGVISRGYAGSQTDSPQIVKSNSDPSLVGDEAVLLARRCHCPVVVAKKRVEAARELLANFPCNVIISDDGLQHLALFRDIEIVVIDGLRRFGNGYCLPVGPLREPQERVKRVDFVVVNGADELEANEIAMTCQGNDVINLQTGEKKLLADFKTAKLHAIAAIGNPQRFFSMLKSAGFDIDEHAFQDHHDFKAEDLYFKDDNPVLMTEKDAVKCRKFAQAKHWYLPIDAKLPESFSQKLLKLLQEKSHG